MKNLMKNENGCGGCVLALCFAGIVALLIFAIAVAGLLCDCD